VDEKIADTLMHSEKSLILLGGLALSHPALSQVIALCQCISELSGAKLGMLTEGANTNGAWLAGALPHRLPGGRVNPERGLTVESMLQKPLQSYLLFNMEPDLDCALGAMAETVLSSANFVVSVSAFDSSYLQEVAHVLLPMVPFTETAGTFVNGAGVWQSFNPVVKYGIN